MNNPGKLARLLKSSRRSASLSLRYVEKQTGISNAYLSQLENGRNRNPSPHVLAKLARAYDVAYSALMEAAGYADDRPLRPPVLQVAMLAGSLNVKEQKEVASFIEVLIARRKH